MERLTQEDIRRALGALAAALPTAGAQRELWVVGGAELKAQYAFDDLWEADRGPA